MSRESLYPALPFHAVRTLLFLSALVVGGSLGYFAVRLKLDGYKIPWSFLIIFLAAVVTLVDLLVTLFIHCCGALSPLFNIFINIPLTLFWTAGTCLMAYNTWGTLTHTCSTLNWGNSDGVLVCNIYKTIFAFLILGCIEHIAQVVLDVRARRLQKMSGTYHAMQDDSSGKDIKLNDMDTPGRSNEFLMPYSAEPYRDNTSQGEIASNLPYQDHSPASERHEYMLQEDSAYRPGMQRYGSHDSRSASPYHDSQSYRPPHGQGYHSKDGQYEESYHWRPRQPRVEHDLGTYGYSERRY